MKVLTVWQPWATLIAIGAKPYEFRGGRPPRSYIGRRIAIHAGVRKPVLAEIEQLRDILSSHLAWRLCLRPDIAKPVLDKVAARIELLPLRMILCTAVLGEPRDGHEIAAEFGGPAISGVDSDRDASNWGWPLLDIEDVVPPVEHKGQQGWSEWSGAP